MILFGIFIIMTAAALPSFYVAPLQLARCATLIFLSAGVLAANALNVSAMGPGVSMFDGLIQATPMTQGIDAFISVIAAIIVGFVWAPVGSINIDNIKENLSLTTVNTSAPAQAEYSVILLFTTLGAMTLVSSTSLVTLYLGVELQSFAVYILASLY